MRHRFTNKPVPTARLVTGSNISVGEHTYGWPEIMFPGSGAKLVIGKYCSISKEVKIFLGGNHHTEWVAMYPFSAMTGTFSNGTSVSGHPATKGDVIIGNDVWIGYGATILSGITIGDGAVIGANATVTKDVLPYSIVGGNPAQFIRNRFEQPVIEKLSAIKWWQWDDKKVNDNIGLLCNGDINAFIEKHFLK